MDFLQHGAWILAGSGIFAAVFKYLLARWLEEIKELPKLISSIEKSLISINAEVKSISDAVEEIKGEVRNHDRQIVELRSQKNAHKSRYNSDNS